MLDPLRSLAELVRTLTRSRTERRDKASSRPPRSVAGDDPPGPVSQAARTELLHARLRHRLAHIGTSDRRAAREAFVETVLASELGEAVSLDPAMAELVGKVSQQLGNDPAIERALAALLDEIAGDSR